MKSLSVVLCLLPCLAYAASPTPLSQPPPKKSAWLGKWFVQDGVLEITQDKKTGKLRVLGNMTWDNGAGRINEGEVDYQSMPEGNLMLVSDGEPDGCRLKLALSEGYLVAEDNGKCTNTNARFDGIYQRNHIKKHDSTHH